MNGCIKQIGLARFPRTPIPDVGMHRCAFIHYRYILSSLTRIEETAERLYRPNPMILFRTLYRGFREGPLRNCPKRDPETATR